LLFYSQDGQKKKQEETGKQYPLFLINFSSILIFPILVYFISGSPLDFEEPILKGFNFVGGMKVPPEFVAMFLGLSIYTASFISEIVRAGILSVNKGQIEAARSLGLKQKVIMNWVIIPQALRVIVPPLTSQFLNLTKNSSLGIAIGYADLVHGFGGISLNQTGQAIECMAIVMATYLTISLTISFFMNIYNRSIQLEGK
jgi:general L-amino acid transport system permease protein